MKKDIILGIIAAFLATGTRAKDGKALYDKQCAKCHGEDGKGQTKMGQRFGAKDYTDPNVQDALQDAAAFKATREGLKKDDKTLMKPAPDLSDEQIKTIIAYMRTFKR